MGSREGHWLGGLVTRRVLFSCGVSVFGLFDGRGRWETPVEPVGLYARAVFRLSGAWRSAEGGLQPAAP